jgi:hypothetical protein
MTINIMPIQGAERWIFCTPLSVNVFVTLAIEQHTEYHCKALFETGIQIYSYIGRCFF